MDKFEKVYKFKIGNPSFCQGLISLLRIFLLLDEINDIICPRHVLSYGESLMVKIVIFFVEHNPVAQLIDEPVNILLVCQSVLLSNQNSNRNIIGNIIQVDVWNLAMVVHPIVPGCSVIKLLEVTMFNQLSHVHKLFD